MTKAHHLNRKSSKEHSESARRILESIDKKNRRKRIILQGKLYELNQQKIAVRFLSSFGPDLDAIDAFKKGVDYQGFTGKGKNKRLKFEVKGNKLYLHGHNIATKTDKGIEVSNAGFDTGLTYATLKELGINAKRTPNGRAILHNTDVDATSGKRVLVPFDEISKEPIRATKPQKKNLRPNRTVTEQSSFREQVESRARAEQGTKKGELPLSQSSIQPEDQRQINKITGVKSKIPKPVRATDAHHIFPVEQFPELKNNPSQGVMVTRKEHAEIHRLNPNTNFRKLQPRISKLMQKTAIDVFERGGGDDLDLQQETFKRFQIDDSKKESTRIPRVELDRSIGVKNKESMHLDIEETRLQDRIRSMQRDRFISEKRRGETPTKIRPPKPSLHDRVRIVDAKLSKIKMAFNFETDKDALKRVIGKPGVNRKEKIREREEDPDNPFAFSDNDIIKFDEEFAEGIPYPRVEGFHHKFVDTKVIGTTPEGKYKTTDEPVNVDRSIANQAPGTSGLSEELEDRRVERTLLKDRGQGETFEETFTRKFGAHFLDKSPAGKEPRFNDFSQGVISRENAKKLAKIQSRLAAIDPRIRKKKITGTVKKKIPVKEGMMRKAKHVSADEIVNAFIKSGIDTKGINGVYDPIQNRILDATIPADKMRIQELFESGDKQIGFNSITDTRKGPNTDIELIRKQLKEIEARGGIPSLGFDEGSLEANDTVIGDEESIISRLLDNQKSTGIVSPNEEFKVVDNPRYTQ